MMFNRIYVNQNFKTYLNVIVIVKIENYNTN